MFSLLAGSVKGHKENLPARAVPIFSPSSGSGLFDDEENKEEEESEDGKEAASHFSLLSFPSPIFPETTNTLPLPTLA